MFLLRRISQLTVPAFGKNAPGMKWFFAAAVFLQTFSLIAAEDPVALAQKVIEASGGLHWPEVKTIAFTFNVEKEGKLETSVKHTWDVAANRDTVEWDGKNVTVDLGAENTGGDARAAYKRWVNDSYWLLAPLKLRDRGTSLTYQGTEEIDGKKHHVLQISFQSVGLTPEDKYNFYIDPGTHLVRRWDFIRPPKTNSPAEWLDYQDFNGLKLSTNRQVGEKRRIYFTDIKVTK
jgi:hypothetical protein